MTEPVTLVGGQPSEDTMPPMIHDCGYEEGSFACRIRHVNMNTGWAKAAND